MQVLNEIGSAVERTAEAVAPAVVGVGARWGRGSGLVVGPDRVATNAHNVRGERVTVTFADGRAEEATVAGIDADGDLAVLAVPTGEASALPWATGTEVRLGTPVFALANPGGRGVRATVGFVSGTDRSFRGPRGRRIRGAIEHTAPLPRGASGGPVVDTEGRLLGINTSRSGEGFYVAIPADESLRERLEALSRGDSPAGPRLRVGVAPPWVARRLRRAVGLPDREGVLVQVVEPDGPGAAAGLAPGDLIVSAEGEPVAGADDLHRILERAAAAGGMTLGIVRGVEERSVRVSFAELAGEAPERA
ncbi:MAG TPA: trypsin-like peptidase domain-containing protein [Actinomycetota bacterium]|nr:trypsin-like peptidase domain-containing protein [Actinomycetota bacterium]